MEERRFLSESELRIKKKLRDQEKKMLLIFQRRKTKDDLHKEPFEEWRWR